jgi:hypothetical protein
VLGPGFVGHFTRVESGLGGETDYLRRLIGMKTCSREFEMVYREYFVVHRLVVEQRRLVGEQGLMFCRCPCL